MTQSKGKKIRIGDWVRVVQKGSAYKLGTIFRVTEVHPFDENHNYVLGDENGYGVVVKFLGKLCEEEAASISDENDLQHEGVDWPDHLQEWEDMLKAKKAQEDDFYARVESKTNAIRDLLVEKNAKYGDVALNPIHIFSPWDSANALKVRIDDKLARMKSLGERDDEDTVKDLIGYLVLYQIAKDKKAEERK